MLKWVAPIITRFKLSPRPHMFTVPAKAAEQTGKTTVGQRMAERVAAFVGSWIFLGGQAFFLFLWVIYNTLQIAHHFDPPPYILLNLLLSFQAAFTGPVLLIAANVGAIRDHKQADRIEELGAQSTRLAEQSERLAEQNAQLVKRLFGVEQMLSEHVHSTLQQHGSQLGELRELLQAVHAQVVPNGQAATPAAIATVPVLAIPQTETLAEVAADAGQPREGVASTPAAVARRRAPGKAPRRSR
jgi:uncharacterized membrane protein